MWASVLGLNVFIFLSGLVGLELIFGGWIRQQPFQRLTIMRSRRLSYDLFRRQGLSEGPLVYTRDAFGLRGSHQSPADITLLTVGGSTTDQQYLPDGHTWQDLVEQDWRRQGIRAVIGNAGVDGQSSIGHLKNFESWFPHVPGLKPRHILFYVGINDFFTDERNAFDVLTLEERRLSPIGRMFRERSALYTTAKRVNGWRRAVFQQRLALRQIDFSSLPWTETSLLSDGDHAALLDGKRSAYRLRLKALAQRARALGAIPIFMTQPHHYAYRDQHRWRGIADPVTWGATSLNGLDVRAMLRLMDETLLDFCRVEGERCADLGALNEWTHADFYDYVHMTPEGTKKLASVMEKRILELMRDGPGP